VFFAIKLEKNREGLISTEAKIELLCELHEEAINHQKQEEKIN